MIDDRYTRLLETAYPNLKSRENYFSRLRGLLKHIPDTSLTTILENPDTYYPRIQTAYPSLTTRKNVLTVLLVLFREDETLQTGHAAAYTKWKKLHDDLTKHQDAKIRRSEPEEKQIENYTSYKEIEAKYAELKKLSPHDTERHSIQYILLSILVHLRPKRADLGAVQIFYETDPRHKDMNYVVLRKKGTSYLVMNLYKTAKYYQTVEEDMPVALVKDILASVDAWPRDYVFRKDDGEPMSNNTYSAFVKATFEQFFCRATGVSLLRHIYITEKLNYDDMTLEEQEEEAKLMLHTSGLARQYKWPKKVMLSKVCAAYIDKDARHTTRKLKKTKRTKPQNQTIRPEGE